jgi:hypothetical protein
MASTFTRCTLSLFRPISKPVKHKSFFSIPSECYETNLSILHANNLYCNEEQDLHQNLIKKNKDYEHNNSIRIKIIKEENEYMTKMSEKHALCYFK